MSAGSATDEVFVHAARRVPLDMVGALLRQHYAIDCNAIERLSGERDQNYRIADAHGDEFVLKISHPSEPRQVTDLQTSALKHIARADPGLPVQRVVPTRLGEDFVALSLGEERTAVVRLFTFLKGSPLRHAMPSLALRRELGSIHARLGIALRDFRHPAADHDLLWDLQRMDRIRSLLPHLDNGERRALATRVLDGLDEHGPALDALRRQPIHNDFNPYNILVAENGMNITGILDFGDLVRAPLLNDVAVAASYLMPCEDHPLLWVSEYLAAYHHVLPLSDEEIELLFPLIGARLVMIVVITGWRANLHPANRAYILRNNPRAWAGLHQISLLHTDAARRYLRTACRA